MLLPATDFPMPIITPRLVLRPPVLSYNDIHEYFHAVIESMAELSLWLPWAKDYPSITQIENYIKLCNINWLTKTNNNMGLPLWIIEKETNKFVGNLIIWNIIWEIPKFEFGYWLCTAQTNKGYITEAVNALTRYCFLQLEVKRIEIRCEIANARAQLVPQRLGFTLEEILHNNTPAVATNKPTDIVVFSCSNIHHLPPLETTWQTKNNLPNK